MKAVMRSSLLNSPSTPSRRGPRIDSTSDDRPRPSTAGQVRCEFREPRIAHEWVGLVNQHPGFAGQITAILGRHQREQGGQPECAVVDVGGAGRHRAEDPISDGPGGDDLGEFSQLPPLGFRQDDVEVEVFGGADASGLHAYIGSGLAGRKTPGIAPKNLLGLPWRVALALQHDGWILRNAIVWHKPNAMPESVRGRLNCRYEMIFLLVKSRSYWFDLDPIRVPHATARTAHGCAAGTRRATTTGRHRGDRTAAGRRPPKYGLRTRQVAGARRYGIDKRHAAHPAGRNPGDVWSIPTRSYHSPHFAAFPVEIPLACIRAGCRLGGTVLDPFCGTGTTGVAARQLGRHFTGIELNPAFAEIAAQRLREAAATEPDSGNGACPARHAHRPDVAGKVPLQLLPKRVPERTLAGPEQVRAAHHGGRTVTATTEDPSAWYCRPNHLSSRRQPPGRCSGSWSRPTPLTREITR
jgi:DNA methylase